MRRRAAPLLAAALASFLVGGAAATAAAQPGAAADAAEIQRVRQAAEKVDADAQYKLGRAYQTGGGVLQDLGQAAGWLRKAADQGHALAQNDLGVMSKKAAAFPRIPRRPWPGGERRPRRDWRTLRTISA